MNVLAQNVLAPNEAKPAEKNKDETSMTSKEEMIAASKPCSVRYSVYIFAGGVVMLFFMLTKVQDSS